MALARCVEPEWLDELPADDPRAIHSRRDLKRINILMFQARIMARILARQTSQSGARQILDIGAGDGTFLLAVAGQLGPRWSGSNAMLLDRKSIIAPRTRDGFAKLGWHVETIDADVFDFFSPKTAPLDVVTASLFLHHFSDEPLRRLLTAIAATTACLAACEPRRGIFPLTASRMLGAIGCNDVTRHDAVVSVRAGFRDQEISALWPQDGNWTIAEYSQLPFSHCFTARRRTEG